MPWFRSLRDELTLSPFEDIQDTPSEGMASTSPADFSTNQEPAEATEECPGKKKSKFQTFKKFFRRKRRKAPPGGDDLKCSVSSDDLSKSREQTSLRASSDNGSEVNLGSRAQSHDSVFASDWSENREALGASQDSLHGKVKNLQMQLKQAMRFGAPPSLLCVKRTEDNGTTSEDDPCRRLEDTTPRQTKPQRNSSISLNSATEQSSGLTSSVQRPLVVAPGDFSSPASVSVVLDSSAARHKLGLRQRAQQRRRPAARSELRSKVDDSVNDSVLDDSAADDSFASVEEELKVQDEDSEQTTASNPDLNLDLDLNREEEEEQDSPGSSPEPPAGGREHFLDPLCLSESSLEDKLGDGEDREDEEGQDEDLEEDQDEDQEEVESSLLLEVLSSLKTPLSGLDVPLPDHHQRETEDTEVKREKGETQEAAVLSQTPEDQDTPALKEEEQEAEPEEQDLEPDEHEVEPEEQEMEPKKQEVELEEQEMEPDVQEIEMSVYKHAEDEVKSLEEESEEELEVEVEHIKSSELFPENPKDNFQEFYQGYKIVSVTQYSDSEDDEMQCDLNVADKRILGLNEIEVGEILDGFEQDPTESEEEETPAAILVQEEKQEPTDRDFEDETGENIKTEVDIEMQNFHEAGTVEEDTNIEDLMGQEMKNCETEKNPNDSEEATMEFESETAKIEHEEAAMVKEIIDTQDGEEKGDLVISDSSPSKTSTATLEINLVSPTAEKHVHFPDSFTADGEVFDKMEGSQEEESKQTSMEEMKDMTENLEESGNEENILDSMPDECIEDSLAEDSQKQDTFGTDVEQQENIPISDRKTSDEEGYGKLEKDLGIDKIDKIEDVVKVSISEKDEIQKEKFEELNEEVEIANTVQEEQVQVSLLEMQKGENYDIKQDNPEKQMSSPEPSRPRFTVATAWQRSLSIEEKDKSRPTTAPKVELENQKVHQESKSDLESQQIQESTSEIQKIKASRPETHVQESGPDLQHIPETREKTQQDQDSKSKLDTKQVQESKPLNQQVQETKLDLQQVQQSLPETQQIQESTPEIQKNQESGLESHQVQKIRSETQESQESRPDSVEESPAAMEGISQNPFGVRLRRTQALQRFIAEDELNQDLQTKEVEPSPSIASFTKQTISSKPIPTSQPITVKTPPTKLSITVKMPPTNPPITAKPSVLNLPITNKLPATSPPVSTKPVVPRKPEAENGHKLKRTSDAGSEPPSWISMAKHKQKIYKENSPVPNKDDTGKKTEESSKVISLNLKPASQLSPPTPVPPVAPKSSHSCPSFSPTSPPPRVTSLTSPPPRITFPSQAASTSAMSSPSRSSPASPISPPQDTSATSSSSSPTSPPPRVASPQDEPPWMALAKKKAKAWSEMPQIVQ